MTSFMIQAHEGRQIPPAWNKDARCIFCKIVSGDAEAHKLFENDKVVAILGRFECVYLSLTWQLTQPQFAILSRHLTT